MSSDLLSSAPAPGPSSEISSAGGNGGPRTSAVDVPDGTQDARSHHCLPFGAEIQPDGSVRFRLFAPAVECVAVEIDGHPNHLSMHAEGNGWHELVTRFAAAGTRYRFAMPDGLRVADPGSRFQPDGATGWSEVIDPLAFHWQQTGWRGRPWAQTIFYELHIGTFTPEGTFRAAIDKLPYLRDLGITAIEVMCFQQFQGRRSWGYDPVLLFAPANVYGRPEDVKAFVDAAHAHGLMVLFDVVFNHFGPEGSYIGRYFPQVCSTRHETPWGKGLNFDEDFSRPVRDLIVHNALYWIEEFRADGLRLDATHTMLDSSPVHILDEVAAAVRALDVPWNVHLVLEHEQNIARKVGRNLDGSLRAFDAEWNYDAPRLLTPVYGSFCKEGARLEETDQAARGVAEGFLPRCEGKLIEQSYMAPPISFVSYIQTHDLVGNRIQGDRMTATAPLELARTLAALFLLMPQMPLLFMGEEFRASTPFPFFCDYSGPAAEGLKDRRREQFKKMDPKPTDEEMDRAPDPQAEATFLSAKLNWNELQNPDHAAWLELYRSLLRLRSQRIVPLLEGLTEDCGRHRTIAPGAFTASWTLHRGARLHLAVNLCKEPQGPFPRLPGEELWSEGEQSPDGSFGPWALRWSLEQAAG